MTDNKNMPAFPIFLQEGLTYIDCGLTKREYFAGLALQGLLAAGLGVSIDGIRTNTDDKSIAKGAIGYADALLAELDKTFSS